MARTFRRKGTIPDWVYDRHGYVISDTPALTGNGRVYYPKYHFLLPKEKWTISDREKHHYHGDKLKFNRGMDRWMKRQWSKWRRAWDRQEFARFAKEAEYEPIFFTTKIDTWWWD